MNHTRFVGWLVCFILALTSACTAVEAPAVAQSVAPAVNAAKQVYPLLVDGVVLEMNTPATYASLNVILKNAASEILRCQNCTHVMFPGTVPGWTNAVSVTLINATETSPEYWKNLHGIIVTPDDWKLLKNAAENVGYETTNPKDVALTPIAMRVANFLAGVGAGAGETMLAGAMLTMDDYMSIVEQELGRVDQ